MYLEKLFPIILSVTVLILLLVFNDAVICNLERGQLHFANLGLAVFSWLALQVGFSFGVYAFIMSKNDGFIGKIKKTEAMKRFKKRLVFGYYSGMAVSFITLPIVVIKFDLQAISFSLYVMLSIWFSLFIFSFAYFICIVRIFREIERISDK